MAHAKKRCADGMKRPLIAISLAAVLSCSGPTEVEQLRELMDGLRADILALIGDPLCDSVDECRYVGFGQKVCGGPLKYLVYSISRTDSVQLKTLVDEHRRLNREWNVKSGAISPCDIVLKPVLARRDGRCVDLRQTLNAPGS